MPKFDKFQIDLLKEYLYYSHIHDAEIETFNYYVEKKLLTISTVNSIYNNRISLTFEDVKIALTLSGTDISNCKQILSLSVEDDYSYFKNLVNVCDNCFFDYIYMLFQMFSGDELHIVCKNVIIETEKIEDGYVSYGQADS